MQVAHYSDLSGNEGAAVEDSTVTYDNIAPTGTLTISNTASNNGSITLNCTAIDNAGGSGVASIQNPDGTLLTAASSTYMVSVNGNYTFTIKDMAGNIGTASIGLNSKSKVLKQGMYMRNNADDEYILTSSNNRFNAVKTMPITIGMMVDLDVYDLNPQISLKIEGSLKSNPITFNKYEVVKDSTTNKYVIKSDTLQSYKPSAYSSEITFTNDMDNSSFSLRKGKQYIIFYSIIPSGDSSQIKISADVDKAVNNDKPASQIILDVLNLPLLQ